MTDNKDILNRDKSDAFTLDVFLAGKHIGTLRRWDDKRSTVFRYDRHYLDAGGVALSQDLPRTYEHIVCEGLHPFFCNLISEGWLKLLQERRLASYDPNAISRFDILAYFGRDCVGAVRVEARKPLPEAKIALLSNQTENLAAGMNAIVPGYQPKLLVVRREDGTFHVVRDSEASTHIAKLKPVDRTLSSVLENELIANLATAALLPDDQGCEMEIGRINGIDEPVLLIQRFDRTESGEALDFREFNQLLGRQTEQKYDGSYSDMAAYIIGHSTGFSCDGINTDIQDLQILFKRLIASFIVGNDDTHLKNFALMRSGNMFRLTPNYDIIACAGIYKDFGELSLKIMGRKLELQRLTAKQVAIFALEMGLEPKEAYECITSVVNNFSSAVRAIETSPYGQHLMARKIIETMQRRMNGTFKIAEIAFYLNSSSLARHRLVVRPDQANTAALNKNAEP